MSDGYNRNQQKDSEIGHVEKNLPDKLPKYFLLPGDPNRVDVMSAQWDPGAESYDLALTALALRLDTHPPRLTSADGI
jgi:hypothetical protein